MKVICFAYLGTSYFATYELEGGLLNFTEVVEYHEICIKEMQAEDYLATHTLNQAEAETVITGAIEDILELLP